MAVNFASSTYLDLKAEVSRMASLANKRIKRLEKNELTELPAYKSWQDNGSIKFSVAGKDYNQLQSEFWRLKNFIDNKTSTVREANKFLKEMAKNTGLQYKGLEDLKKQTTQFFKLADKIKEYYKSSEKSALSLDYQKIWEQINVQIKQGIIDITGVESSEVVLDKFIKQLDGVSRVESNMEGYQVNNGDWEFIPPQHIF